jgi:hypothetical protein
MKTEEIYHHQSNLEIEESLTEREKQGLFKLLKENYELGEQWRPNRILRPSEG